MSIQPVSLFALDFFQPLPIRVETSDAPLTSDAGLPPLLQFDQRIGLTQQFADALHGPRDADLVEHSFNAVLRRESAEFAGGGGAWL